MIPEWIAKAQNLYQLIGLAIRDKNLVDMQYKKEDGTVDYYIIEPYSLQEKGGKTKLFGKDAQEGTLKSFNVDHIFSIRLLNKEQLTQA